jgi:hypothetical protein
VEADHRVVEQVKVAVLGFTLTDDQDLLREPTRRQRLDEADSGAPGWMKTSSVRIGVRDTLGIGRTIRASWRR